MSTLAKTVDELVEYHIKVNFPKVKDTIKYILNVHYVSLHQLVLSNKSKYDLMIINQIQKEIKDKTSPLNHIRNNSLSEILAVYKNRKN